jgi:hypothetical protein
LHELFKMHGNPVPSLRLGPNDANIG